MSFRTIVVAAADPKAVERISTTAHGLFKAGGSLHLLICSRGGELAASAEALEAVAKVMTRWPLDVVAVHVRKGSLDEEATRLSAECSADVVVLDGNGTDELAIAQRVLRWSSCSVLVIEPNREATQKDGLIQHVSVCPDCEITRERSHGRRWFCPAHDDPKERLFQIVKNAHAKS